MLHVRVFSFLLLLSLFLAPPTGSAGSMSNNLSPTDEAHPPKELVKLLCQDWQVSSDFYLSLMEEILEEVPEGDRPMMKMTYSTVITTQLVKIGVIFHQDGTAIMRNGNVGSATPMNWTLSEDGALLVFTDPEGKEETWKIVELNEKRLVLKSAATTTDTNPFQTYLGFEPAN